MSFFVVRTIVCHLAHAPRPHVAEAITTCTTPQHWRTGRTRVPMCLDALDLSLRGRPAS